MKCNCGYDESSYLSKLNHRDEFLKTSLKIVCRNENNDIEAEFNSMYICPACGTMKVNIKERR